MTFWDKSDLPFTYSLTEHFPIGERYFSSVLAQTYPNRRFLFAATASGTISTDTAGIAPPRRPTARSSIGSMPTRSTGASTTSSPQPPILPNFRNNESQVARTSPFSQFAVDAAAGNLPQFTFLDPNYGNTSEENPQDIQVGEQFVRTSCRR